MSEQTPAPAPEPAWYWVTHHIGYRGCSVRFQARCVPAELWSLLTKAYHEDQYLTIPGDPGQVGVPARNVTHTTLERCATHEIPDDTANVVDL